MYKTGLFWTLNCKFVYRIDPLFRYELWTYDYIYYTMGNPCYIWFDPVALTYTFFFSFLIFHNRQTMTWWEGLAGIDCRTKMSTEVSQWEWLLVIYFPICKLNCFVESKLLCRITVYTWRLNLDGRRPRVRRYAQGLGKLVRIGKGKIIKLQY